MILKIKFFYKINLYSSIIKYIQASSFFSFLEKKRTFLDFGWGIGVRFFYWQNQKNAPQFPTQNPQKNWHFEIKKKKTHLFKPSVWVILGGKSRCVFFKNLRKNVIFWGILGAKLRCVFSRIWGKMWFFGGFWVLNWGAFFQDPEEKNAPRFPNQNP